MNYLRYLFADSRIFVRRSLLAMTTRASSSKTASRSSNAAISNAQVAEA
ncbi:hypothetical protein [Dictyobacter halimunensis]